jgi:hypothetical protein
MYLIQFGCERIYIEMTQNKIQQLREAGKTLNLRILNRRVPYVS